MYTDQTGVARHVRNETDYTCTAADFPFLPAPAAGSTYAQTVLNRPNTRNCVMRTHPDPHVCDANCTPSAYAADNNKDIHNSIDLRETPNVGLGVFATANLQSNTVVGLYTGHLMDDANLVNGQEKYAMALHKLNGGTVDVVVDSWAQGGWTRFVNHSCVPNLKMASSLNCGGIKVLYFRTTRTIRAGEQLFLDYGREYFRVGGPRSAIVGNGCLCGQPRCHSRKRAAAKRSRGKRAGRGKSG